MVYFRNSYLLNDGDFSQYKIKICKNMEVTLAI